MMKTPAGGKSELQAYKIYSFTLLISTRLFTMA